MPNITDKNQNNIYVIVTRNSHKGTINNAIQIATGIFSIIITEIPNSDILLIGS